MSKQNKKLYEKVIDEKFIVPKSNGGGLIKFEAWEFEETVVKYSMVYINRLLFCDDNGRVLGYDNAHDYHHKHYLGDIYKVDDFVSYQDLVQRFRKELKEFIK